MSTRKANNVFANKYFWTCEMYAYLRSHISVGLGLCVSKNDLKMWIWEVFTRWEWDPDDQNVFLRGEVEDSSQLWERYCAQCLDHKMRVFLLPLFCSLVSPDSEVLVQTTKKTCQKSSLMEEIAKLKTINHNWPTQVSFRMSEENTAGCQVRTDNFCSIEKKISFLSTKAAFPWESLSETASVWLIFISVLNILGRGQIKTPYNTEGKDEVIQKDGRRWKLRIFTRWPLVARKW